VVAGGAHGALGDHAEIVALGQAVDALAGGAGTPEGLLDVAGRLAQLVLVPVLGEEDPPGAEGHDGQHGQNGVRDASTVFDQGTETVRVAAGFYCGAGYFFTCHYSLDCCLSFHRKTRYPQTKAPDGATTAPEHSTGTA
jgi:hypothetical protein